MTQAQQQATEFVTHFGEHAEYTGVRANDRDRWLALRHTMITASQVAALLGEDEHMTALELYVEKTMPRARGETPLELDDPRFWGLVLEQPILRAVAAHKRWRYWPGGALLRSRKHPWIGATLDAEIDRDDGLGWIPFEGKTTRLPRGWDEESGELPTRVLIQSQVQLLVTGAPVDQVFALLQGSRPCAIEVHPSPEFFALIVEETEAFLDRIRRLDPPPATGTERERRAIERMYPRPDGSAVRLPDEAVEWTREYFATTAEIRRLERRKLQLQNLLRASIGAATFGVLPEPVERKACWSWATQRREAYSVPASESRVLRPLKLAPLVVDDGAVPMLPPAAQSVLEQQLEESIQTNAEVTRLPQKRRRRARR